MCTVTVLPSLEIWAGPDATSGDGTPLSCGLYEYSGRQYVYSIS
jgi:hypothetical protein